MIDLSVTRDPEWIKKREELWKPIGESLSEGLKKKEVDKVHHYFMTGTLRDNEEISDGAKFYWFPIQTPEAWNYIFENLFESNDPEKEYKEILYFQIGELSHRAIDIQQELLMWDYFLGDKFVPTIMSKVPIGKERKVVSLQLDKNILGSKLGGYINSWLKGSYGDFPKWISRADYYFSFIESLDDEHFELNENGEPSSAAGYFVKRLFSHISNYNPKSSLSGVALKNRFEFLDTAREKIKVMNMPPKMKILWNDIASVS